MRKRVLSMIMMGCLLLTTGCSGSDPGTPPEVMINGTKVVIGETKPKELEEQGFILHDTSNRNILLLPKKTWANNYSLKQDELSFATLTLANHKDEVSSAKESIIEELTIYLDDKENTEKNVTINGINPSHMSEEDIIKNYPEATTSSKAGDSLFYYIMKIGDDYRVYFYLSDNVVSKVEVKHAFDKSYKESK